MIVGDLFTFAPSKIDIELIYPKFPIKYEQQNLHYDQTRCG